MANVIIQVATTDAVVTTKYLVKISTFDGLVLWKTAITTLMLFGDGEYEQASHRE